jgi:DNA-binding transcriptional ArsR family regulator
MAIPKTKTKIEIPHPLPDPLVERVAERFRVLGELTVKQLQEATGASQQNVSQHLGVLLRAGIVGRRKQRNYSHYRITDPVVFSLCDEVCGGLRRQLDELDSLLEGGG